MNWSSPSKRGFIDTGYVGYVRVGSDGVDCLIVESELSKWAGSTPMYAVEDYFLCHDAVEEVVCVPDKTGNTIKANVVKSAEKKWRNVDASAIIKELLVGHEHAHVSIDATAVDMEEMDQATRKAVTVFFANGNIDLIFVERIFDVLNHT